MKLLCSLLYWIQFFKFIHSLWHKLPCPFFYAEKFPSPEAQPARSVTRAGFSFIFYFPFFFSIKRKNNNQHSCKMSDGKYMQTSRALIKFNCAKKQILYYVQRSLAQRDSGLAPVPTFTESWNNIKGILLRLRNQSQICFYCYNGGHEALWTR